jgi:hypothetical protein
MLFCSLVAFLLSSLIYLFFGVCSYVIYLLTGVYDGLGKVDTIAHYFITHNGFLNVFCTVLNARFLIAYEFHMN